MEIFEALEAFSSLSQETRLRVFKLIIEFGGTGLGPKQMLEELKIPDNTLSFHLSHLSKSGLITSRREGRQLFYSANTDLVNGLIDFLKENCCVRDSKSKTKRKCWNGRKTIFSWSVLNCLDFFSDDFRNRPRTIHSCFLSSDWIYELRINLDPDRNWPHPHDVSASCKSEIRRNGCCL